MPNNVHTHIVGFGSRIRLWPHLIVTLHPGYWPDCALQACITSPVLMSRCPFRVHTFSVMVQFWSIHCHDAVTPETCAWQVLQSTYIHTYIHAWVSTRAPCSIACDHVRVEDHCTGPLQAAQGFNLVTSHPAATDCKHVL